MKLSEAVELNSRGKLSRPVLTEAGWYVPNPPAAVEPVEVVPEPKKPRKPRKAK